MKSNAENSLYAGVMSGTSLDGIDAVVARFAGQAASEIDHASSPDASSALLRCEVLGSAFLPFPAALRTELLALQTAGDNELVRSARAALALAALYAQAVRAAAQQADVPLTQVRAAGVHGQTIRHCPAEGWSCQLNNPARIAESLGIDVVADFRSRDLAAGGQGAPLVPAFHHALFQHPHKNRVILNIGGMANITEVSASGAGAVRGFDTGPGNVLLDSWYAQHQEGTFDRDGAWAASGQISLELLALLLAEPFFTQAPPKSTGRDTFNQLWLAARLQQYKQQHSAHHAALSPADVQATLLQLTVVSIAEAIRQHAPRADEVFVCGGGACNSTLMRALAETLAPRSVLSTQALGVDVQHVEALAFAWLARETLARRPANVPEVTGAAGPRVLGAVYPA